MRYTIHTLALLRIVAAQDVLFSVPVSSADAKTGRPGDGFLTVSIEFATIPDYAGNLTYPNQFSQNMLDNLAKLAGKKMYIRAGGNTMDMYTYNSSLEVQITGEYNNDRSKDYPTENLQIGPSFFEAYKVFPGYTFSHGLNLGGDWHPNAWESLLDTTRAICDHMDTGSIEIWEYGNEPNFFVKQNEYRVRGDDYREPEYVREWLNGTKAVQKVLEEHCPEKAGDAFPGWLAPSAVYLQFFDSEEYDGPMNSWKPNLAEIWELGQNDTNNVKRYGLHNYIDMASRPVTLASTLMNHTRMRLATDFALDLYRTVDTKLPVNWAEHNSVAQQGQPGLSNAFGAALWGIDLNLYIASKGVERSHMHMGTNYRYQPWQPIETDRVVKGTKGPYYGQIAVAAFIADNSITPVDVAEIPLAEPTDWDVAYAAYVEDRLARVMALNLREYNYTQGGVLNAAVNEEERPVREFAFDVDLEEGTSALVRRIHANGSDAISGISFDGWSYNWELDNGKPVRLDNVTTGETIKVREGRVVVRVPDSEAVMLEFDTPRDVPGPVASAVSVTAPITLAIMVLGLSFLLT